MHQQINLYQPIFRKERKIFSANALLQIAMACLFVLALIAVFFQIRLSSIQQTEKNLQQQQDNLRYDIESLKQKGDDAGLESLEEEITLAESALINKQDMLEQMRAFSGQHRIRFTPYLDALSRQRLSGLWLTHIRIDDAGHSAQLEGIALQADLIPQFLQILPQEESLEDLHFHQVIISRQKKDPRRLDFRLQTQDREEDS